MSSEQRSSSAVRNLRSLFENKASDSPDSRGRSSASPADIDSQRPRSKIRSSFIPVQPAMATLGTEQPAAADLDLKRESSAGLRRESFSEGPDSGAIDAARETVNTEQERRENESSVAETISESAVETPVKEVSKTLGGPSSVPADKQAENPDKHVTGAEEEPAVMRPADPTDEAAVSGGEALSTIAEDLRKDGKSIPNKSKPTSISTRGAPKSSTSLKSPASQPRTPVSAPSTQKAPTKKASRSSLTAPTAASVARAAAADKAGASKQPLPAMKPKSKEPTKPVEVSSRLTAPTAATRARLESSSTTASTKPVPAATRAKPTTAASAKATPRPSLARPDSRASQTSGKKPAAAVDGSFLERMTRPTAASTNRAYEKVEAKTPPKKLFPLRPKPNGIPKGPSQASSSSANLVDTVPESAAPDVSLVEEDPNLPQAHDLDPAAKVTLQNDEDGEMPTQADGHQEETPAPKHATVADEEE